MCNTQKNSLLLNQHNGDDAPENYQHLPDFNRNWRRLLKALWWCQSSWELFHSLTCADVLTERERHAVKPVTAFQQLFIENAPIFCAFVCLLTPQLASFSANVIYPSWKNCARRCPLLNKEILSCGFISKDSQILEFFFKVLYAAESVPTIRCQGRNGWNRLKDLVSISGLKKRIHFQKQCVWIPPPHPSRGKYP